MPDWCQNYIYITHSDPAKLEALAEAVRQEKFCNHVIPVPEDLKIAS